MTDKRQSQFKWKSWKGKLIQWSVFLALLVYLLITLVNQNVLFDKTTYEYNQALARLDAEKLKNNELKEEYHSIGTDAFYEKVARDVFGYIYPNEKVFYESKH